MQKPESQKEKKVLEGVIIFLAIAASLAALMDFAMFWKNDRKEKTEGIAQQENLQACIDSHFTAHNYLE